MYYHHRYTFLIPVEITGARGGRTTGQQPAHTPVTPPTSPHDSYVSTVERSHWLRNYDDIYRRAAIGQDANPA